MRFLYLWCYLLLLCLLLFLVFLFNYTVYIFNLCMQRLLYNNGIILLLFTVNKLLLLLLLKYTIRVVRNCICLFNGCNYLSDSSFVNL